MNGAGRGVGPDVAQATELVGWIPTLSVAGGGVVVVSEVVVLLLLLVVTVQEVDELLVVVSDKLELIVETLVPADVVEPIDDRLAVLVDVVEAIDDRLAVPVDVVDPELTLAGSVATGDVIPDKLETVVSWELEIVEAETEDSSVVAVAVSVTREVQAVWVEFRSTDSAAVPVAVAVEV